MKFKPLAWDVQKLIYWSHRNKLGLISGAFFGLAAFLVWNYQLGGMQYMAGHLMYPLFLIFGCSVPFWGILIAVALGAILGACLDTFLSPSREDKKLAITLLLILGLAFLCMYFYREKISEDICIDIDGDNMDDSWEVNNGLNQYDSSDADLDNDNDGYTNQEEFENDTDPNNPYDPGVVCHSDSDCEANQFCESTCPAGARCVVFIGICKGEVEDGGACASSAECVSGLCANNICSDELPAGSACSSNNECASNLCEDGICSVPPGQIGFTIDIIPG